jgi:hypothetical protein
MDSSLAADWDHFVMMIWGGDRWQLAQVVAKHGVGGSVIVSMFSYAACASVWLKVFGWVRKRRLTIAFACFAIVGSLHLLELLGLLRMSVLVWTQARNEEIRQWLDTDHDSELSDAEYGLNRWPWCVALPVSQIFWGLGIDPVTKSWKQPPEPQLTCCEQCKNHTDCFAFVDDAESCQLILGDKSMQLECSTSDEGAQPPVIDTLVEIFAEIYKRPAIRIDLCTALIVTMVSYLNANFMFALHELRKNPTRETLAAEQSAKSWARSLSQWLVPVPLITIPLLTSLVKFSSKRLTAKLQLRSPDDLLLKFCDSLVHGDLQQISTVVLSVAPVLYAGYQLVYMVWVYAEKNFFKRRENDANEAIGRQKKAIELQTKQKTAEQQKLKEWEEMNHSLVNFSMNTLLKSPGGAHRDQYTLCVRTVAELPLKEVIMEQFGQQRFQEAFENAYKRSTAESGDEFSGASRPHDVFLNFGDDDRRDDRRDDDSDFSHIMCAIFRNSYRTLCTVVRLRTK